ncbi:3'5'-cyclic nucleotide phosphodiesterase, putative [Angomonas deanei]|uniref:3'5'-cyclic nucleotide phosphodiesterase, putative n=1 Tax=Angomonas deanei TaxID=59799 RepID=A0A7G2CP87_9TRYP|nr:3'5'-cyclic nucleotide phosphodiesterase, putative [Angomonas deanei]
MNVLLRYEFVQDYNISIPRLYNFFKKIETDFFKNENPYHNFIHASDVIVAAHQFLTKVEAANFSDLELFSFLFSSIVMHIGHCGLHNKYINLEQHVYSFFVKGNYNSPQESIALCIMFLLLHPSDDKREDERTDFLPNVFDHNNNNNNNNHDEDVPDREEPCESSADMIKISHNMSLLLNQNNNNVEKIKDFITFAHPPTSEEDDSVRVSSKSRSNNHYPQNNNDNVFSTNNTSNASHTLFGLDSNTSQNNNNNNNTNNNNNNKWTIQRQNLFFEMVSELVLATDERNGHQVREGLRHIAVQHHLQHGCCCQNQNNNNNKNAVCMHCCAYVTDADIPALLKGVLCFLDFSHLYRNYNTFLVGTVLHMTEVYREDDHHGRWMQNNQNNNNLSFNNNNNPESMNNTNYVPENESDVEKMKMKTSSHEDNNKHNLTQVSSESGLRASYNRVRSVHTARETRKQTRAFLDDVSDDDEEEYSTGNNTRNNTITENNNHHENRNDQNSSTTEAPHFLPEIKPTDSVRESTNELLFFTNNNNNNQNENMALMQKYTESGVPPLQSLLRESTPKEGKEIILDDDILLPIDLNNHNKIMQNVSFVEDPNTISKSWREDVFHSQDITQRLTALQNSTNFENNNNINNNNLKMEKSIDAFGNNIYNSPPPISKQKRDTLSPEHFQNKNNKNHQNNNNNKKNTDYFPLMGYGRDIVVVALEDLYFPYLEVIQCYLPSEWSSQSHENYDTLLKNLPSSTEFDAWVHLALGENVNNNENDFENNNNNESKEATRQSLQEMISIIRECCPIEGTYKITEFEKNVAKEIVKYNNDRLMEELTKL